MVDAIYWLIRPALGEHCCSFMICLPYSEDDGVTILEPNKRPWRGIMMRSKKINLSAEPVSENRRQRVWLRCSCLFIYIVKKNLTHWIAKIIKPRRSLSFLFLVYLVAVGNGSSGQGVWGNARACSLRTSW